MRAFGIGLLPCLCLLSCLAPAWGQIVNAAFSTGTDGFEYVDDSFGTALPNYAIGTYDASRGRSGGGLVVRLGPGPTSPVGPMSGGWKRAFTLNAPATVQVRADFRMILGRGCEPEEFGRVLLAIDATLFGSDVGNSLVHRAGDGDGGIDDDTGWLTATYTVALSAGQHILLVGAYLQSATRNDEQVQVFVDNVSLTATGAPASYQLLVSGSPDRSNPSPLQGATLQGDVHVFTSPDTGVTQVSFWIDDPERTGPRFLLERRSPFDLTGSALDDSANPYDTRQLTNGTHTVTARLDLADFTSVVISSNFTVSNSTSLALTFNPASVALNVNAGQSTSTTVNLTTNTGIPRLFSLSDNATWLTVAPSTGSTPSSLTLSVNSTGLAGGTHTAAVLATSTGVQSAILNVTLTVGSSSTPYQILLSLLPNRSSPVALEGRTVSGNLFVFTLPNTQVTRVSFFIDDPGMAGAAARIENSAPFDLAGGTVDLANPYNSAQLIDGAHIFTAKIDLLNGTGIPVHAGFTVQNQSTSPALTFSGSGLTFDLISGQTDSATATLSTSTGAAAVFSLAKNASWLTFAPPDGSTPATITVQASTSGLVVGTYSATITATAPGFAPATLPVTLNLGSGGGLNLFVSLSPDRSSPVPLLNAQVAGMVYIFAAPPTGLTQVKFYADDPQAAGAPFSTEKRAPFDLAGGTEAAANPFDSASLNSGSHEITAVATLSAGGTSTFSATFQVGGGANRLDFNPNSVSFALGPGATGNKSVNLSASDGMPRPFSITGAPAWLGVSPSIGTTPALISLTANASTLEEGSYSATLTASSTGGYLPDPLPVSLSVGAAAGCAPLPCSQILVELPYPLSFGQDHGKILDKNGIGTGFTYVDRPTRGTGYVPANLEMKPDQGVLSITSTAGLATGSADSQDNALGVGIDGPSQVSIFTTTIKSVFSGTGKSEQAGLWFGNDDNNYVKHVVQSNTDGMTIELSAEVNGSRVGLRKSPILPLAGKTVTLVMNCEPATRSVRGSYRIDNGAPATFTAVAVPPEFFSFDAAGIDPEIGTRTFGGIFASHRNGASPVVVNFEEFSVVGVSPPPAGSGFSFNRVSHTLTKPTSMVWGPDNRLYVLELMGIIHALTYDAQMQVVNDQVINSLVGAMGPRLSLGITVEPASVPGDVRLWVASSSPSLTQGLPNSGAVTKLSGENFSSVQQIITGLPRAIANHATNSIHFGPDGRLYIAQGGNTGAGAPNTSNTEFGDMQEQPLSAAILVADVFAPGFRSDCHNASDIFGPPPCDVITFCTGLRNLYDFVFHTNGSMYGPDNGLGVTGTYPPTPTPPCNGFGEVPRDFPGEQRDPLVRLVQGRYYGHPNPHRNECVFGDGSKQGVPPLPNYEPPIYDLGSNRSADGIIEYKGDAFCGGLKGDLLIANYSSGDDITRVRLSANGQSVLTSSSLVGSFNDPLPLCMGPNGTIFVGEFGGNKVTTLLPLDSGCWATVAPLPVATLDPGGTAVAGKLYVLGGEAQGGGHVSTLRIYTPATNSWSTGSDLPGPAVENPTAVEFNGKLYVFGGATASFTGAVRNAAVYEPLSNQWTELTEMPTARSGAAIGVIGNLIYVVGGLADDGASLNTVEAYDPASNSWSPRASMIERRDGPGGAVLGGKLYVFGGRTRNADGTSVDDELDSAEMYDPAANQWLPRASMPTGRRSVAVGLLNGRAQVMGGERSPTGGTFAANEEYNPDNNTWRVLIPMKTPRHGMAYGTIDSVVYVAGGGPNAGTSFSNIVETFRVLP